MPEGPSIVILKELLLPFKGKKVIAAEGNAKIDLDKLKDQKVLDFKAWGKHTLICFKGFYIRIHLLMFGSYRINEEKENAVPRLKLKFKDDEINFYTCSVRLMEANVDDDYDWEADVLSDVWSPEKALKKVKVMKQEKICDVLLNQDVFSGVGNIIKNEVLFRTYTHPESVIEHIPLKKLKELVKEARGYSFDFLAWKREYVLKKHWLIYKKKECPRCKLPVKAETLGKGKRFTSFCEHCQVLYCA